MNPPQNSCVYEFEGFLLDPLQRTLRTLADGQTQHLSSRAFDALYLLVERRGQLVDKETLIKTLWPKVVVEENNLTQVIYTLRQTLGEKPGEHRFIATAAGRGYQFVAVVKEVPRVASDSDSGATTVASNAAANVPPPAAIPAELPVPGKALTSGATARSRFLRWSTLALALLLVAGAGWLAKHRSTANTTTPTVQQTAAVAVLPFVNLTGDASKEYLGDGMAEELINTLNKVPGLKIPARTSSFAYKGRNTDIRQIAKDLGVSTILEGSVRAAGQRIRITAQLINAQDGLHLWSETYDEEFTDLFKLQDKLATQIAEALQVGLGGGTGTAIPHTAGTTDVEAYNLNLQGYSLLPGSEEQLTRALELLQQAIQHDPNYARAWSSIGLAHFLRGLLLRSDVERMAGERAARQALALDPDETRAHALLCTMAASRNFVEAESHCRAALANDSTDACALSTHAGILANVGHLREALAEVRKGYALAPAHTCGVDRLAYTYSMNGRDTEAARWASVTRTMVGPGADTPMLRQVEFLLALREGRREAATDALVTVARGGIDETSLGLIVAAMADPAQRPAAIAIKSRFYPKVSAPKLGAQVTLQWIVDSAATCMAAYAYATANLLDEAYNLANRCLPAPMGMIVGSMWAPESAAFRRDPRFAGYVDRFGRHLNEYWQQYGPPDDCDLKDGKLTCH